MRELTKRIMTAVIAASVICLIAMALMVGNVNAEIHQYESMINGIENRVTMSLISENMYRIENCVMEHIISDSEDEYKAYESQIDDYAAETDRLIEQLRSNLSTNEEYELLHQVTQAYTGFLGHKDVVLGMSRKGMSQSASYYLDNSMSPYLDTIDVKLDGMSMNINLGYDAALEEMNTRIRVIHIIEAAGMCISVLIIVLAIVIVVQSNRHIITKQESTLEEHQQKVMDMQSNVIIGMANLIESRDGETGGHVKRTTQYVALIAGELVKEGLYTDILTDEYIENLCKAAPMHDVGKIKVSDAILLKPGKLTEEEFAKIKVHTSEGGKIIYDTMGGVEDQEYLKIAHDVATYHHEKWNGKGYPEGLSGEEIPLCARIMAVADVFDALVSERCYKKPFPLDQAFGIIEQDSGSHFDPVVGKAFLTIRKQVEQVKQQN